MNLPGCRRVCVVEDRPAIRQKLKQLLNGFAEFKCVLECSSGEEALQEIPRIGPEVAVIDIFLPHMSGIECTARLKTLLPQIQILVLTACDDEELIFPALEAGADGYLLKQDAMTGLRAALLNMCHGGVPMTSGIARRICGYFRDRAALRGRIVRLSTREKEILDSLSKGFSNKEIASQLSLSVETIHSYLKNMYEKMHVHSRGEAVAKYALYGRD